METAETQKEQMEVAQMRFGVIAPLVQGTYTDVSMAAYCRRMAQTPQRLPDGRVFQYKHQLLSEYIRRHNTTKHSGTGQSPLERYMASNGRIRRPVSREWLDEAFHNRVVRNVNRDATVHLLNECYDAPMQFIGQKVEVRFLPGDTGSAYILYSGQHYPLRLTDRVANGRTKRQTALAIDYAKEGSQDVH